MTVFTRFRRLVGVTVIMYVILNAAFINSVCAAEEMSQTLRVSGEGIERIASTLTNISLGVEIQGKTAIEVQKEIAKRSTKLVKFLKSRRVKNLETTGITLQPNYNYSDKQRELIGYIGRNNLIVTVEGERAGQLLDEAIKAGANRINNLSFTATEQAIEAAEKQALIKAVNDAKTKAKTVLNALNLTSKEIFNIQINYTNLPQPFSLQAAQYSRNNISTPVIAGKQEVKASVTLVFKY